MGNDLDMFDLVFNINSEQSVSPGGVLSPRVKNLVFETFKKYMDYDTIIEEFKILYETDIINHKEYKYIQDNYSDLLEEWEEGGEQ